MVEKKRLKDLQCNDALSRVSPMSVSLSRDVSSPTQTHIDTGWEPTTCRYPSTAHTGPVSPTTSVMVQCACLTTKVSHSPASVSASVPTYVFLCAYNNKDGHKCLTV